MPRDSLGVLWLIVDRWQRRLVANVEYDTLQDLFFFNFVFTF